MPDDGVMLFRFAADAFKVVEDIFDDLSTYSKNVDGITRRACAAAQFATARPPRSHPRDKHTFVAYRHGVPIGLLDIIDAYPVPGTAFIGLLAIRESLHGAGLGRSLYGRAEHVLRTDLNARIARIAVVETNPVTGFWRKMGFTPTGEVKPYDGEAIRSRAILMEKVLPSSPE